MNEGMRDLYIIYNIYMYMCIIYDGFIDCSAISGIYLLIYCCYYYYYIIVHLFIKY